MDVLRCQTANGKADQRCSQARLGVVQLREPQYLNAFVDRFIVLAIGNCDLHLPDHEPRHGSQLTPGIERRGKKLLMRQAKVELRSVLVAGCRPVDRSVDVAVLREDAADSLDLHGCWCFAGFDRGVVLLAERCLFKESPMFAGKRVELGLDRHKVRGGVFLLGNGRRRQVGDACRIACGA
jgi:hypothetical protein